MRPSVGTWLAGVRTVGRLQGLQVTDVSASAQVSDTSIAEPAINAIAPPCGLSLLACTERSNLCRSEASRVTLSSGEPAVFAGPAALMSVEALAEPEEAATDITPCGAATSAAIEHDDAMFRTEALPADASAPIEVAETMAAPRGIAPVAAAAGFGIAPPAGT